MSELKLPQAWQDWHVTEEIGEGAYGRVYRAEKNSGGVRAVSAIKVIRVPSERSELLSLRREFQSEEELRRNLKEMVDGYVNEIRAMYRLQGNTHIVSIQDHLVEELEDGFSRRILIRMEYLQSFDDYAMTHSFSREEIIRLGISLCEALGVCAGNGILHRDIKPENLFVTETGQFKLGDFGIAKALDKTIRSYSAKGTFTYMAPEVFHGKPYDSRADLYSTGMILYKLTNRNRDPFIDPDKQIITHQDREQAMSLRMQGGKLPPPADADSPLAGVILKACEYDPKNRYSTPDEMKNALQELLQPAKEPAGKRKKKWLLPVCAAILLLAAGLIILLMNRDAGSSLPDSSATEAPASLLSTNTAPETPEPGGTQAVLPDDLSTGTPASPLPTDTAPETPEPDGIQTALPDELSTEAPASPLPENTPDSGNTEIQQSPAPGNPAAGTQLFGGVRYPVPEGFEKDESVVSDRKAVWACGPNLLIGFQLQPDTEYVPSGKGDRKIGGYDATYDPENLENDEWDIYECAIYANPDPETGGSVCVYLIGTDQDRAAVRDAFIRMLDEAEGIQGTSVLQNP